MVLNVAKRYGSTPNSELATNHTLYKPGKGSQGISIISQIIFIQLGEICPVADFEKVTLGDTYTKHEDVLPLPDPRNKHIFYRHRDEIEGSCCKHDRCSGYLEIHHKVNYSMF